MGEVVSTIPTSKRHFFELFFCSKQWPQKVSHFTICCLHHGDGEKASLFTSFILAASSFGFLFCSDARFRTKTTKVRRGRIFINYDEFIEAVLTRWPKAIVQGTAGVALAGLLGTVRAQGRSLDDFPNHKIVVVGAGSAGLGVLSMAIQAVVRMTGNADTAAQNFFLLNKDVE